MTLISHHYAIELADDTVCFLTCDWSTAAHNLETTSEVSRCCIPQEHSIFHRIVNAFSGSLFLPRSERRASPREESQRQCHPSFGNWRWRLETYQAQVWGNVAVIFTSKSHWNPKMTLRTHGVSSIKNAPFNDMAEVSNVKNSWRVCLDQVEQAAKVEVNFEVKTAKLDQIWLLGENDFKWRFVVGLLLFVDFTDIISKKLENPGLFWERKSCSCFQLVRKLFDTDMKGVWVFRVSTVAELVTVSTNRWWLEDYIHIVSNERKPVLSCCFLGVLVIWQEGGKLCGGHGSQTGPQGPRLLMDDGMLWPNRIVRIFTSSMPFCFRWWKWR